MISTETHRKDYTTKNMGFLGYLVGSCIELTFGQLISFFPLLSMHNVTMDFKYGTVTDPILLDPTPFVWVYSFMHDVLHKIGTFMAPLG